MWQNKIKLLRANYVLQPCQRETTTMKAVDGPAITYNATFTITVILLLFIYYFEFLYLKRFDLQQHNSPASHSACRSASVLSGVSSPCCERKVKQGPCQAWKVTLERGGIEQARERRL